MNDECNWAELEGKVTLVTGGAMGIGKSIAQSFARHGARIVLVDMAEEQGVEVLDDIRKEGGEGIFVKADLSKTSVVKEVVEQSIVEFGKIDVLVNNAATLRFANILEIEADDWDIVLNVNLKTPVFLMKAVAKQMVEKGIAGKIINIASIDGLVAEERAIPYSASKAALLHITRCAAVELAKYHINVNAIAPGTVKTEFVKSQLTQERIELLKKRVPWPDIGTPEDVSGIAVFLASPLAKYMTGATIVADGGWTIDGTAR